VGGDRPHHGRRRRHRRLERLRRALDAFEEEYGYALRAEDFIDEGYYNSPVRSPSRTYRDWVDFQARFVSSRVRALVDIVHDAAARKP